MDIILYNIIIGFVCFFFGYFFGSIPTGVIIGNLIYKKDPRTDGSKNMGGTNVGRLFGKKAGISVIILDMIKTAIPMITIWLVLKFSGIYEFFEENLGQEMFDKGILFVYLAPLGAAIGHCWPIYVGFRGGKAVSCTTGFAIFTSWTVFALGIAAFFGTIKLKKMVSLASMVTAIIFAVFAWGWYGISFIVNENFKHFVMWGWGNYLLSGWEYASVATIMAIILIGRHNANIRRIKAHQENKIKWMK